MFIGALLFLVLATATLVIGVLLLRHAARLSRPVRRVCVEGIVIGAVGLNRPPVYAFEYPAPDGSRLRGQARIAMTPRGFAQPFGLRPGGPIPVYVDPENPVDAVLAPGASGAVAPTFGGIVLLALAAAALGGAAVFLLLGRVA